MRVAMRSRERIRKISPTLEEEFDGLAASIGATWDREHDPDTGGHTDVSLNSVAANNEEDVIGVLSGLRLLLGPLLVDLPGNNAHQAGLRPPIITGNQNNYAPAGIDSAIVVEVESDAGRDITGIRHYRTRQKRILVLGNRGNFTITLRHNNASSIGTNRFSFYTGADIALSSSEYIILWYDVGSEIWRPLGTV